MFNCSGRKFLIGVVTGTLLSTAVTTVVTADDKTTHRLLDSRGNPVMTTRPEECVLTPRTPNTPPKLFKECGDIGDRDKDGILDDVDVCPDNTPEEISKGVYQTGPRKGCPIDSDDDGVEDYRSYCPNNSPLEISQGVYDDAVPLGRALNRSPQNSDDKVGCPLDTDRDCVQNYRDECPNTPFKVDLCDKVDERGCLPHDKVKKVIISEEGEALFAFDSAKLTPYFKGVLDMHIQGYTTPEGENILGLNNDRISVIEVVGHTDPIGTKAYNQKLSDKRAASVVGYLVSQGVDGSKISSCGKGETELVERRMDEPDKVWRARCRRVVITPDPKSNERQCW